jgi:hypothetical protein
MDRLVEAIVQILQAIVEGFRGVLGAIISAFVIPASWIGLPPEILAAVIFCFLLVVLWRSLGGRIT